MPAAESHRASELVGSILTGMGKWFGIDVPQQNLDYNIRKLAHFLEFAILGVILCNVYAAFGVSHRTATGYILFLGLVTDVILDFSGVFFIWLTREVWSWAKR